MGNYSPDISDMNFIVITTSKTFDLKTGQQIVGGIQTYTCDLCHLAKSKGYAVSMIQLDAEQASETRNIGDISFQIFNKKGRSNQSTFDEIYALKNTPSSLFVLATDQMDVKTKADNVIVIQHGIAFDNPITSGFWSKNRLLLHINKMVRALKNVRRLYWSKNTVCVDYNYYNLFRTLGMIYPGKKVKVIPNYSSGRISEEELSEKLSRYQKDGLIKIVFARRFCDYRGTLIFSNCVDRLLPEYPNLDFTFAGGGELKGELERRYSENPRVHITSFAAPESIRFHRQYDIAVVPTIFSEGTSLSLLEAMSAGCFPIATHVGGMTNIVLDHYNGLMCYPSEEGVYNAIVEAVSMSLQEYKDIVTQAYMSATRAFSAEQWQNRWSVFMDEVMGKYAKERIEER